MSIEGSIRRLYEIVVKLRSPDGCPWDREQTPASLRSHLIEESYEAIEAIDRKSPVDVQEELGDIVMLVVSLARMYEEDGVFAVSSVFESVSEKLVRRHPHVFGESSATSTAEVLTQWERIKVEEEGKPASSGVSDRVARSLPALERAYRLQKNAAKVGFDWPDFIGVLDKLQEEISEVSEERNRLTAITNDSAEPRESATRQTSAHHTAMESEVGDLLFSAVNVARYLGVDPSIALNRANRKFTERFRAIESQMASRHLPLSRSNLEVMEEIWNSTKGKQQ